eukprot:TRINITY_DN111363_c0_g1_i1.p1 TRINITY_DN111363_c0_g1~~TRINITY_DN111363_c0_g1_i1.p1  ORF type:complete len:355 (-),score=57.66 TRINITY_DN111363_c0_g1_i1:150-1166(-)
MWRLLQNGAAQQLCRGAARSANRQQVNSLREYRRLLGAAVGLSGAAATLGYSHRPTHMEAAPAAPIPRGRSNWTATPLKGKVAIVTGASQGIGAGIAVELAHAGADVCVNFVGCRDAAENVASEVRSLGCRAILVEEDVSDRHAVERLFARTEKELGTASILVTNAVTSKRDNILETDPMHFERTLRIGLFGVFHCMQCFSRSVVAAGLSGASIVHIGSPHAMGPFKDAIDYNVAKAGADHLAKSVANELMWKGIRVNTVQPGWTFTEGELRLYSREALTKAGSEMPFGRLGAPEDIGKAAAWLCSDEAAYITGATLRVDGGQFIETAPSWQSKGRHA